MILALFLSPLTVAARCDYQPSDPSNSALAATPSQGRMPIEPSSPLEPKERIENADLALHDGDYEVAIVLYQEVLRAGDAALRRRARLPLAQAYFAAGRYAEVVALCSPSYLGALSAAERALAVGLQARSHEALGQWQEAIWAYERHLELEDAAAPEVRLRVAKVHRSLGQTEQALQQLRSIELAALGTSGRADVLEEQAELLAESGDQEGALAAYDDILGFARAAYYRSDILQRKGRLLLQMGRSDEGVAVLRRAVREYPQTWGAYAALQALDELGETDITLLQRGQILYHVGQYQRSVKALEQYRQENPYGYHSTAHLYAGLAHQALDQHEQAVEAFDAVIDDFGWTDAAGEAWMAKARSVAALGKDPAQVYVEFAERYPAHPRAPEALWRAALALEREGDWEGAGKFYGALQSRYADDSRAAEAGFREALTAYALGDYGRAQDLWERRLQLFTSSALTVDSGSQDEQARLLTWMGLTSAGQGQLLAAQAYWREAASLAPNAYYSLRARDLLAGDSLRLASGTRSEVPGFGFGDDDWQRVDAWIESWTDADNDPPGAIGEEPLVRRADVLWALGWHDEAMGVYRRVRDSITEQPRLLLGLAQHCYDNDVLAIAISCATRLIRQGHSAGAAEPPSQLWELAYPTAYGHLAGAEAATMDLDPLLFLALVRQESQFHPYVASWAGAIGLAQVMPKTGAWIAQRLGLEPFDESLLLRPVVSVRLGTWYLAQALELFDRSWPAAVAAYNAGWTSVLNWLDGEPIQDPDLFYETIPLAETKAFVGLVYENYRAYQRIYRPQRTPVHLERRGLPLQ